jgi:hypothetical protein
LKQIIILISTFICCFIQPTLGQNKLNISAEFFPELNKININQKITITNTTQKGLDSIYLSDWNNSYSSKKTDLAIRFAEEYSTKLHFSNEKEKGFTNIKTIKLNNFNLKYIRTRYDIISVLLNKTLQPNEKITLNLEYVLQLPSDKFSRFGIDNKKNIKLKEWFLIPAKLTDTWQYYSNKDLDDLYFPNSDITIGITIPKKYDVISDLDFVDNDIVDQKKNHYVIRRKQNKYGTPYYY